MTQEVNDYSQGTLNKIGEILNRKASVARLVNKTLQDLNQAYQLQSNKTPADLIFDLFRPREEVEESSVHKMIKVLRSFGIMESDPRLKATLERLARMEADSDEDERNFYLTREPFKFCIQPAVGLISRALRNQLVIPNWDEFTNKIEQLFNECRSIDGGKVATYIPQLARQDPNLWGLAICTIDGQRCAMGDSKTEFCVQSVSKAFNYAIVSTDLGADVVHSYVGYEPSGRFFNEICLDPTNKPHNPMINAGAIITSSLIKNRMAMADRFDFVLQKYKQLAGGEFVGFNNATFLSERDSADRNYALSYYMKEYGCFPPGTLALRDELDLYFQLCSLETTCESLSVMAATLANGGVCPLTNERCVDPQPCRDVLSLMYSCGMYDLSGKFAFQVGLPAKSGVSGAMIVVIPNVMGICLFAPPLDKTGNSTKGVAFCKKLIQTFNFHNYDSLDNADSQKIDPRRRGKDKETEAVVHLLFNAKNADIEAVKRFYMQGGNLESADYDGRTALHIAASEGHYHVVKFLLHTAKVNFAPKDRWGRTPLDDARLFDHDDCAKLLSKVQNKAMGTSAYGSLMEESEESDFSDEEPPVVSKSESETDEDELRMKLSGQEAKASIVMTIVVSVSAPPAPPVQSLNVEMLDYIPTPKKQSVAVTGHGVAEMDPHILPDYVPTPKKTSANPALNDHLSALD